MDKNGYVSVTYGQVTITAPTFELMQQAVLEYARMVTPQSALAPQQQPQKRKLTPEGRKRIAAATKRRHEEAKAKKLATQGEATPIQKKGPAKVQTGKAAAATA